MIYAGHHHDNETLVSIILMLYSGPVMTKPMSPPLIPKRDSSPDPYLAKIRSVAMSSQKPVGIRSATGWDSESLHEAYPQYGL